MGATSATGVGQGSVEGANMGSKHWTVGASRILGPRIMVADRATLSSGSKTVVLPLLSGAVTDYIVVAANYTNANAFKAVLTFNTNDTTLTLSGTGSDVIQWAIIKVGMAY